MSVAIKAENISKAYQIGEFSTGTITKDINRWWKLLRGKEDPYITIGETNDRSTKGNSNIVWSLKDINFEINQGDAVGIIGKNGAGKSTLLKVLSRVTTPTTGNIKVKGRVASLLEVGTGFHPDLTGKENIYLNGAILGMRKHEIKKHFDAIVDFSGVERYIDTPVKRYSSGMYVRLAFAVAAHLESEILIVDEVLAVGDAEFQKKCLGKMGNVSKSEGRTILFVSHNMGAVASLCNAGLYLKNGIVEQYGTSINNVVHTYLNDGYRNNEDKWEGIEGDENVKIYKTKVYSADTDFGMHTNSDLFIIIEGEILKPTKGLILGFTLWSEFEYELAYTLYDDELKGPIPEFLPQKFRKKFKIPANTLSKGTYRIQFDVGIHGLKRIVNNECDLNFNIDNINGLGKRFETPAIRGYSSIFRPNWYVND